MHLQATPQPTVGQFRAYFERLSGRRLGAFKGAAAKTGLAFDEYVSRLDAGLKRCVDCNQWLPGSEFRPDRTRWDMRSAKCAACNNGRNRARYVPVAEADRKPPGPLRAAPRDGDKLQARYLVNRDVKLGRRQPASELHCAYCGHKGPDRRHEFHHHMGYSARHHYDVIPLCALCHAREH